MHLGHLGRSGDGCVAPGENQEVEVELAEPKAIRLESTEERLTELRKEPTWQPMRSDLATMIDTAYKRYIHQRG
jgi:hypothetical protein